MMAATASGDRSLRIDGLRRTVSDLRRSVDFYCGGLGFERSRTGAPSNASTARLRLGEQHIDLILQADPMPMPVAAPAPDPRFQHAAIATDDMEAACRRLEPYAAVSISRGGPQVLPAHTGGVTAFKFRDPDGHPLELIRFPVGVGDPCWQISTAAGPTLGIDHFALVVEAIDKSTAFFATQLDLRVTGRGVNRGLEQDRLDGLDGVEVDVISLEPRRGRRAPHLELLMYRHPAFASQGDASTVVFEAGGADVIVCLSEASPPVASRCALDALALRDPDGHRFEIEVRG